MSNTFTIWLEEFGVPITQLFTVLFSLFMMVRLAFMTATEPTTMMVCEWVFALATFAQAFHFVSHRVNDFIARFVWIPLCSIFGIGLLTFIRICSMGATDDGMPLASVEVVLAVILMFVAGACLVNLAKEEGFLEYLLKDLMLPGILFCISLGGLLIAGGACVMMVLKESYGTAHTWAAVCAWILVPLILSIVWAIAVANRSECNLDDEDEREAITTIP